MKNLTIALFLACLLGIPTAKAAAYVDTGSSNMKAEKVSTDKPSQIENGFATVRSDFPCNADRNTAKDKNVKQEEKAANAKDNKQLAEKNGKTNKGKAIGFVASAKDPTHEGWANNKDKSGEKADKLYRPSEPVGDNLPDDMAKACWIKPGMRSDKNGNLAAQSATDSNGHQAFLGVKNDSKVKELGDEKLKQTDKLTASVKDPKVDEQAYNKDKVEDKSDRNTEFTAKEMSKHNLKQGASFIVDKDQDKHG